MLLRLGADVTTPDANLLAGGRSAEAPPVLAALGGGPLLRTTTEATPPLGAGLRGGGGWARLTVAAGANVTAMLKDTSAWMLASQ